MNESQEIPIPKRRRFTAKRILIGLTTAVFLYLASFALNSRQGGYWGTLERDGRDRWSFGMSLHTAVLWQPRFGYWAPYRSDWLGSFYSPLIQLDRQFLHPTRYVSDPEYFEWANATTPADWHPQFRPEVEAALARKAK